MQHVIPVVNDLLRDNDVVYLCEFNAVEANVAKMLDRLTAGFGNDNNFYGKEVLRLCKAKGHARHSSAFIYNPTVFEPCEDTVDYFYTPAGGLVKGNYRVGQRVSLRFIGSGQRVNFYCSHWPGHNETDGVYKKEMAAAALYSEIKKARKGDFVLCLGDYNAEPYEISFATLDASRSDKFTIQDGLFYNPFWKYLGEGLGTLIYPETCCYKAYELLYDQILVNKDILNLYSVEANIVNIGRDLQKGEHRPVRITLKIME